MAPRESQPRRAAARSCRPAPTSNDRPPTSARPRRRSDRNPRNAFRRECDARPIRHCRRGRPPIHREESRRFPHRSSLLLRRLRCGGGCARAASPAGHYCSRGCARLERSNVAGHQTASLWSPIWACEILFSSDFPATHIAVVRRTSSPDLTPMAPTPDRARRPRAQVRFSWRFKTLLIALRRSSRCLLGHFRCSASGNGRN
jgi:hypothetical protein